jgi:outer membrane protein assembly factor BamB
MFRKTFHTLSSLLSPRRPSAFSAVSPFLFYLCSSVFICGFLIFASCPKSDGTTNAAQAIPATDWPIFRGDPGLTGIVPGPLPGRLVLDFTLKVGDELSASPVMAGGLLYAAALEGKLVAYDLASRALLWEFTAADGFEAAPLVLPGVGLVMAGGLDGFVYALDLKTGKLKWRAETEGKIVGSANAWRAADGRTIVLVGSWDNSLYAYDAVTGKLKWSLPTGNYLNGSPAVSDGLAAIGGCDARVHVIDLVAGKERGYVDTGAYIAASTALAEGVAYVGTYAGSFLAIDVNLRKAVWTFRLPDEKQGFSASAAVTDASVVIGAKDGFIYCLSRVDGKLLWKFRGRAAYESSPLIGGSRVFAAASDGELVLLDLASGRLVSRYDLGAGVTASPAYASGRLAVAARDGNVYVFKGE